MKNLKFLPLQVNYVETGKRTPNLFTFLSICYVSVRWKTCFHHLPGNLEPFLLTWCILWDTM